VNVGNIRNKGIELSLFVEPIKTQKITWVSTFNFSRNRNKVISLSNESLGVTKDNPFVLTGFGVNMYSSQLVEGGSWGDLYGNKRIKKDASGNIVIGADGKPILETGTFKVGSIIPNYMLSWNNSIDFAGLTLNFLIDGRFGGKVMSVTQSVLDQFGASQATQKARDNGGVNVPAVNEDGSAHTEKIDAEAYYSTIGGRAGVAEAYMYDATNIRLRELSLGYRLPFKVKGISSINISIVGRNLFFFKLNAPFDPEIAMSTGNGLQGVDVFGMPSAKSIGFNLRVGL
jgi:hypothetical protein